MSCSKANFNIIPEIRIIKKSTSRLRNLNMDWHLSENEILVKISVWAKNFIKDIKRIEERYFKENSR